MQHQDWAPVNAGRSAKPFAPKTEAEKKQDLIRAKQKGEVSTQARDFVGGNKSAGGHGPMGTTAGAAARKIAEETETFKTPRVRRQFNKS